MDTKQSGALVGIVMGSDTDYPVMSEAGKTLEKFGVPYEIEVVSAHRTPARAHEYASTAAARSRSPKWSASNTSHAHCRMPFARGVWRMPISFRVRAALEKRPPRASWPRL